MKLAAVVLFTVFTHTQCLSDEQKELLKKWHMECFEETKVSPDLVLKLKTGDWRLDNKLLKKWTLCILRKYDLMSDEGVFRLDNALAMVPDRVTKPLTHVRVKRNKNKNKKGKKGKKNDDDDKDKDETIWIVLFIASFFVLI